MQSLKWIQLVLVQVAASAAVATSTVSQSSSEMEVLSAHQLVLPKILGESYTISQIKTAKGQVGFWLVHSVGGHVANTKTLPKEMYTQLRTSFEKLPLSTDEVCQQKITVQVMERKKNSVRILCRDQKSADQAYSDLANELTRLGRL